MGTADIGQWFQMVLLTPIEPETYLGAVRLPSAW
jgi:hypothetical protein